MTLPFGFVRHRYCCFFLLHPPVFIPCTALIRAHLLSLPVSLQITCSLLFPSPLPPTPCLFTFLVSAVTPGYIFTLEDLKLGTSDDREPATFWVWVTSFNMVFSSPIHLTSQTLEKDLPKCYILTSLTTVTYQGLAQW